MCKIKNQTSASVDAAHIYNIVLTSSLVKNKFKSGYIKLYLTDASKHRTEIESQEILSQEINHIPLE